MHKLRGLAPSIILGMSTGGWLFDDLGLWQLATSIIGFILTVHHFFHFKL